MSGCFKYIMNKESLSIVKLFNSLIFFLIISLQGVFSQSLPVGFPVLEEYARREQLMSRIDSTVSMFVRPLQIKEVFRDNDTFSIESFTSISIFESNNFKLKVLPFIVQSQFNSHQPMGNNTGSMIPNKGLQKRFSSGIHASYKIFTIQLMPEYVFAENRDFEEFNLNHYEIVWPRLYHWWNNIDHAVRMDEKPYYKLLPGQSSFKVNHKGLSAGISTENLWWGPGKLNSLLMGNNAGGFFHFTLNTYQPIKTTVGSFEGQFIMGSLGGVQYVPVRHDSDIFFRTTLFHPKRAAQRSLSGITLSWQPKWLPGLFVGYSRVSQVYTDEIESLADRLPFFNRNNRLNLDTDLLRAKNHQMSSVNFRWLLKESNAEIYAEYGKNGGQRSLRDFIQRPNQHRAFTVGVSKIYPLKKGGGIQFDMETTQLGQVVHSEILEANSWYTHHHVRHGYTHNGKVIGAGIGPGSNVQNLTVNWVKGPNRIGIFAERLVHNNDFYYFAFESPIDFRRHWTDLSTGLLFDWRFNNFLLSSHMRVTKTLNYHWYLMREPDEPWFVNGTDVVNFHSTLSLAYFLK
jgi:hypothetical protein